MKKFKNRQHPSRFDIVGHKEALKIWCDSLFKRSFIDEARQVIFEYIEHFCPNV